MKIRTENPGSLLAFTVLSAITWLYIWLRAWNVQFTIDESATFFMYIQPGRFIPPWATVDANNHILNSLLSWCCFELLGTHPVVLRLPNILAAIVYFYFTWKISGYFRHNGIRWMYLVFSLCIHFIIEFFGYARGYGLSMAFLLGAVYYTLRLPQKYSLRPAIGAQLLILLSLLSNFNIIFTALALIGITFVLTWIKRISISRRSLFLFLLFQLLIVIPLLIYILFAAFEIRRHSGFYYGAPDGFMEVTANSLAGVLAGNYKHGLSIYGIVILIILSSILAFQQFKRKIKAPELVPAIFILILLLANWACSVLNHLVWHVNYQEDRAAMHYIPLLILFFSFIISNLQKCSRFPYLITALPFLFLFVHSAKNVNLHSGIYGERQQVPDSVFSYISSKAGIMEFPPIVSAWQTREQSWSFMNYRTGGKLNPIQSSGYPSKGADMIILENDRMDQLPAGFDIVINDLRTNTILAERNVPASWDTVMMAELQEPITSDNKYIDLYRLSLTDVIVNEVLIKLDYRVVSPAVPLEAAFVVEIFDEDRNMLIYEAIDLDQLKPAWNDESDYFRHSMIIRDIPPVANALLLYFWSKHPVTYTIKEGTTQILYR